MASYSLAGFAARLLLAAEETKRGNHEGLEKAAVMLENHAKGLIGHPNGEWPPLAQSTLDRKGMNTPLLETGAMQASIQHNSDDHEANIGSDDPHMKFSEYGTAKEPPRPVLGLTAIKKGQEAADIIGKAVIIKLERTL
jgi:phage gpG-like protein